MQIEGADHEFASLEGVYEDVTDIILNIKRLRIRHPGSGVDPLPDREERRRAR